VQTVKFRANALLFLLALIPWGPLAADSNFFSNPYLPYPPACVRKMDVSSSDALQGVKFHDGQIDLYDMQSGDRIPVMFAAYRSPCSEASRSLIWLEFSLTGNYTDRAVELELPYAVAEPREYHTYGMNLVAEPNGWGAWGYVEREHTHLASEPNIVEDYFGEAPPERRWVFLLDNGPDRSAYDPGWWSLSPADYNGAFRLWLNYLRIAVPATAELLPEPGPPLPLSGRHSGTWVIEGAANQGFQLSISEQVGGRTDFVGGIPELPLVLFFSQYTFDAESRPLWLVGNAEFQPGATRVTLPVFRVSEGQFRGGKPADRERIGQVTLTSRSCNNVAFRYDYSSLGLGAGSRRLQRLFSLETAGYDCRDYEARVAANR
jgi:hypothetical protein